MAKRILSADSALMPSTQVSLTPSVRTEQRGDFMKSLSEKWDAAMKSEGESLLFDWQDQRGLREEIQFVNSAQATLDEAAVKLAPSLLRIVLTVKANLPAPADQRAYLAKHLRLDFRRISELCIVADSYGLLDADYRNKGEAELQKYGWSNSLKLAYVRDPYERREIWERACGGKPAASYRAVLEEIRRFRERKLIAPPVPREELSSRLVNARKLFTRFASAADRLESPQQLQRALGELEQLQKELARVRTALKDQTEVVEMEEMAASA